MNSNKYLITFNFDINYIDYNTNFLINLCNDIKSHKTIVINYFITNSKFLGFINDFTNIFIIKTHNILKYIDENYRFFNKIMILNNNYIKNNIFNYNLGNGVWLKKCLFFDLHNYFDYMNNDLLLNKNPNTEIPLCIYQTWHTLGLPFYMKRNLESLKINNPEFTYMLFDDNMCRDFIEKHYNKDVLYAFDNLIPGAFKADLWRYCVLYKYGGIYLDIKFNTINNFKLIELTDKEYFPRDRKYPNLYGIYQALLVCKPGNEILMKCINTIIKNVKDKNYNLACLEITGPQLMNKYFTQKDIEKFDIELDKQSLYINYKSNKILEPYNEYRFEQKEFSKNKLPHYSQLYKKRMVYK